MYLCTPTYIIQRVVTSHLGIYKNKLDQKPIDRNQLSVCLGFNLQARVKYVYSNYLELSGLLDLKVEVQIKAKEL